MADELTLQIAGRLYGGWTEAMISRGLRRVAGGFSIGVSERWAGQPAPWQIVPFAEARLCLGADLVLTGYVDEYNPEIAAAGHRVRITGRSKTEDLIDCTPDIAGGQFAGFTLAAIAASLCAPYGIGLVVETDAANQVVAEANMEHCETGWQFLERLCRLAGVLAMDSPKGELVLTRAGDTPASGRLMQGQNIKHASGKLSSAKRFSDYIVKGQMGLGAASAGGSLAASYSGAGGKYVTPPPTARRVQTQMRASAQDPGVPRYRPRISVAESQLTLQQMQRRAEWQRNYAYGQSISADITVQGWRQPDGVLWTPNTLVTVDADWLGVQAELLIAEVRWSLTPHGGRETTLTVGPVAGYTPDPGQVRLRKHRGGKGKHHDSGIDWTGAGER